MATQTLRQPATKPTAVEAPAPVRWAPILGLAGTFTLVLLLISGRYGYDGDELYFISAGEHLSWSYADQPPLVPLLAWFMDTLVPGSLVALRAPSALLVGIGVVLAALIAREFGGRFGAQFVAGAAYGAAPFVLWSGHLLATVTIDAFFWTLVSYLVVSWVRRRDDRLLLLAGVSTAVALQVKYLIPMFWLMLAGCALVFGPRTLPRRPMLWLGGLIAVLATLPSLWWQAAHGWPHLWMASAVATEQQDFQFGRLGFPAWVALYAGPIGIALAVCGVLWLLRTREYRFLGWTVVSVTALVLLINGRPYYLVGLFPLAFAAGAVWLQDRAPSHRQWRAGIASYGVCLAAALTFVLPAFPLDFAQRHPMLVPNPLLRAEIGWSGLADDVAAVYRALPRQQRTDAVVLADAYPHAAALEFYGPSRGLPTVYSGHRGYWYFGRPADSARTAIVVGGDERVLRARFAEVRRVGRVGDTGALDNVVLRRPVIWVCSEPRQPWSRSWPDWLHMNVNANQ